MHAHTHMQTHTNKLNQDKNDETTSRAKCVQLSDLTKVQYMEREKKLCERGKTV